MRWLIGQGLRNRRSVAGGALLLLLLGIWQFPTMKTDVLPEFAPTTVEVQTEALGLSASEVEQLITVPLEQDLLNGVAWMRSIRSKSVPGLSSIEMIFEPGTPLLRARQVVQERLTGAAALPNVSKPPQMLQPTSSVSRVMMVGVSSKTLTPIQLGVLARWTLRPNLLGVDGVSNVAIFGQRERQLQVQVDPARLAANNVGLDQIIETTGNALWVSPLTYIEASTPGAGGFIETPNQRLTVQHESPIVNAAQLARVAVDGAATPLTLGDVATVVEDHQPLIGDVAFTADPSVLLIVEKHPGKNTTDVTERVKNALDLLAPGLTAVEVDTEMYEPAAYIEQSINSLQRAFIIGAILAGALLVGLLRQWRTAAIAGVSLVVSGVVAVMVLYVRGVTINAMVVAGFVLALALVIQDTVSLSVAVTRRMQGVISDNGDSTTPAALIRESVLDERSPSLYSLAILMVAAVPLLVVDGLAGASFFPAIAKSYLLAVIAASLVALLLVPALSSLVFGLSPAAPGWPRSARMIDEAYSKTLGRRVENWRPAFLGCVGFVVAGLIGLTLLDTHTIPTFRETDLLVKVSAAPGTSLDAMERIATKMNAELLNVAGVERVGSHIGRAITSDQVVSVSSGETWLRIDDDGDYDRTITGVRRVIESYPGVRSELLTHTSARLTDVIEPGIAPLNVRIFGEDRDVLIASAQRVQKAIEGIDGVVNPTMVIAPNEPSLRVKVNLEAAQQAGVLPGDVRRAAATLLQGLEVGNLFEDQRVFEVIVVGTPELRQSVSTVENLMISTPDGKLIRLADLASVSVGPTPMVIERDASARVIDVVASVRGRSNDSVAAAVDDVLSTIQFPLAVHAELIGDYQAHRNAVNRVWAAALVAALLILLIVQSAVNSWKLAGIIMLAIVATAVGGVIMAILDQQGLTIGHIAGLVGAIGLGSRSVMGVVLTSRKRQLAEPTVDPGMVVARVAAERAVPMAMALLISLVAFIPVALLRNSSGGEIVAPLALVIIGSLVSNMVVSLWIVPSLYRRFAPDPLKGLLFNALPADPTSTKESYV